MAKSKYASLHAGMIKTVQPRRTVILCPDKDGNLVRTDTWALVPGKAA